jgi:phytoene dehydrogenase-like protein
MAKHRATAGGADTITIAGGGIAGLVAAITCAEAGAPVRLLEAHEELGGRARSSAGPFIATFGPHALYKGRSNWRWLKKRGLLPAVAKPRAGDVHFLCEGKLRRTMPAALIRALPLLGRRAPVERDFRSWATDHCGERAAAMLCGWAGAFSFDPDPGRLSAAFVWERMKWLYVPPAVRYVVGGWGELVEALNKHARELGVEIETGSRVESLPAPPVIVATELDEARRLLGEEALHWESPHAVLLDIGLETKRGDPGSILDLDGGVLLERVSAIDPSVAPSGADLVQAHVGIPFDAPAESGVQRIEEVLDCGFEGWRERVLWRRRQVCKKRTGALDLPGMTWQDRPAIERRPGIFLAGDAVAAPGVLSEVSFESAQIAARLAARWAAESRHEAVASLSRD